MVCELYVRHVTHEELRKLALDNDHTCADFGPDIYELLVSMPYYDH